MEIPRVLRQIKDKFSPQKSVEIVGVPSADDLAAREVLGRRLLTRMYTDPSRLEVLGRLTYTLGEIPKEAALLQQERITWGMNPNSVPALMALLEVGVTHAQAEIARERHQALYLIPQEKRSNVEVEVLLESQRSLTESLTREGLSQNYRSGASEMLKRIEGHLAKHLPQGEQDSI